MTSENFDVWLFAVDLVNYVFLKCSKLHPDALVNSCCPNSVCKGFTEILKTAVQLITESVRQEASEEFAKFQQQYKLRPDTYIKHCKQLKKERSSPRCSNDAEGFLNFSVRAAFLAHCFHSGGDRRAQVSAVFVISDDYWHGGNNAKFGMWEALNRVAEKMMCGTDAADTKQQRPECLQLLSSDADTFSSPEIEPTVEKSIAYNNENNSLMKTVRCNLSDCSKDLTRSKSDEMSFSNRRTVVNRRTSREHALKMSLKPMPSLEESLEDSMEELYISKGSRVKFVDQDGSLNSTDEFEFSWKLRKLNKNSPKRQSIDRQIFRLSPISPRHMRQFSPRSNTSFS